MNDKQRAKLGIFTARVSAKIDITRAAVRAAEDCLASAKTAHNRTYHSASLAAHKDALRHLTEIQAELNSLTSNLLAEEPES